MINSRKLSDHKFFMAVMDSIPRQLVSYALFSGENMYSSILWFSEGTRDTRICTSADFSWNLAFFLNRNRKHRAMPKTMPSLDLLANSVIRFLDKLQWRSYFYRAEEYARLFGDGDYKKRGYVKIKHKAHSKFNVFGLDSLPELEAWSASFRTHLISEGKRLWSENYGGGRNWCNAGLSASLALDEMHDINMMPVPTDKGGGFTLVSFKDLITMHEEIFAKAWYQRLQVHSTKALLLSEGCEYGRLCAEVAEFSEVFPSAANMVASITNGVFIATLINTVKAHKLPGEVSFRPIHACSKYGYAGLSLWLCSILKPIADRYAHLSGTSEQILHKACLHGFPSDITLAHIDLDDFFMSGAHPFLVKHVGSLVGCSKLRTLVRKVLSFLLKTQYIQSSATSGVRHMCNGTSQGLPHSGLVAILAFLHSTELAGAHISSRNFMAAHGILHYQRAIDNMLFVLDKHVAVPDFLVLMNFSIAPYSCKIEDSGDSVEFFDFSLFKGSRFGVSGRLDFKPVLRNKGLYLPPDSAHQSRIHVSWPVAYVKRLHARSSSVADFFVARDEFLQRLSSQCFPTLINRHIIDCTDYFKPYMAHVTSAKKKTAGTIAYCVLPYHPVWRKLTGSISRFSEDPHLQDLLAVSFNRKEVPRIAVSWKQTATPFAGGLVKW